MILREAEQKADCLIRELVELVVDGAGRDAPYPIPLVKAAADLLVVSVGPSRIGVGSLDRAARERYALGRSAIHPHHTGRGAPRRIDEIARLLGIVAGFGGAERIELPRLIQ